MGGGRLLFSDISPPVHEWCLGEGCINLRHYKEKTMSNIVIPLLQFLKTGDIIALQADSGTGLYLSRINHGGDGGTNPIEAAKSTIDVYSQFRIIRLKG